MRKPLIIGLGNPLRGDDAVGLEIASALEKNLNSSADFVYCRGNTINLLDIWKDRKSVFLIDAIFSGEKETGFLHRFEPLQKKIPAVFSRSSTHLMDVSEVIELGQALGNFPEQFILYGIESDHFSLEEDISDNLKEKLPNICKTIEEDILQCMK